MIGRIARALGIGLALPLAMSQAACTKVLGFGTATKFGVDISQRADQTIDVSMGYDRAEIASIPAPKNDVATQIGDGSAGADAYSVLGTFRVVYGNPWDDQPLILDQVFATGWAARKAASIPSMRVFFGREAGDIAARSGMPTSGTTGGAR